MTTEEMEKADGCCMKKRTKSVSKIQYCVCPRCKQRDRRKLPAWCRNCNVPMIDLKSEQGKALAPKKSSRGEPKTAGKRQKHNATGDAVNAFSL